MQKVNKNLYKLNKNIKQNSLYIYIYTTMTELQTNELLTAILEISKQISEKQNEKRNLQSQKNKLEYSIKNLETEIEDLQNKLKKSREEYYEKLLNEVK